MNQNERYAATAYLLGAVGGCDEIATAADDSSPLLAKSPMAAARMWYWRLSQAHREACVCVVVSAWPDPNCKRFASYKGPELAFSPIGGWRDLEPALVVSLKRDMAAEGQPALARNS